ncbi:MAG: hypothetical protein EXS47_02740 [Candidatus Zambryskibacteria bacterium]|nr:hypothetical protein [Candidatus Zambryskibacteria bacterium]
MDQNNDDRGIDLSHALDDSSSRIKFEGEEFQRPRSFQTPTPKIVQLVIKYSGGYVKDEKQASYVLIGFVAVAIVVSIFLFFSTGTSGDLKKVIPKTHYIDPPKPWANNI